MGEVEKKTEEKNVEEEKKAKVEGEAKKAEGGNSAETKDEKKDKKEVGKKQGDGGEMKAEGGGDEGEKEASSPPPPPPPEEIVIRVYMHCEGCARTVRRSLKGFEGVEDVKTDCQTHEVVVKGKVAAADPLKVVDRVQRKSRRKVELLTPIPPKPEKEAEKKEEEKPKPEEKKEEAPPVMAVVLKVHMHCEACSLEIKKRILKMKGVQAAEPDVKNSQVTVKGLFEPAKLVEYVYKRTGKHAVVVKAEPAEKKPEKDGKDQGKEKKADGGGTTGDVEKKDGSAAQTEKETKEGAVVRLAEVTKNPFQYYYPRYQMEYAYPPQIFSDENPNACSVM